MGIHVVVMGVCGCGKSTVIEAIRDRLGFTLAEGDDMHPRANVEKMHAGHPLTDEDRWPWLRSINRWMVEQDEAGHDTVVSCSALKRSYRDLLSEHVPVFFLHLTGPRELIAERLGNRKGHFMPASMLDSQLETLEPLQPDENGCEVSIEGSEDEVVERAIKAVEAAMREQGDAASDRASHAGRIKRTMQMGMIGLGRMGGNMVRRLRAGGHDIVGFDVNPESDRDVDSLEALVAALDTPRVVWVMVPSGKPTEATIDALKTLLEPGDIVIDGGNAKYTEDRRHADSLAERGIRFLDCGVSGGVWGADRGYALMLGGDRETFDAVRPLLETLKPEGEHGLALAGPVGGGHFAKMVHNGIEYGMMQAFGEGFATMMRSEYVDDPAAVMDSWREGSVVASWLLDLFDNATQDDPELKGVPAVANESGEAKWMIEAALELGVPTPATAAALWQRQSSRGGADDILRVVTAMRAQFGGHVTKVDEIARW
nr:decarboxylating 6-phosphogluconate dehydrogenase [Bifidobacterium simiarum]